MVKKKDKVFLLMHEVRNRVSDDETKALGIFADIEDARKVLRECAMGRAASWGRYFGYDPDDKECKVDPMKEGELPNDWEVIESSNDCYYIAETISYDYLYRVWIEEREVI